ncbi:hypothetical protein Shyhy02_02430 [Streptomyces hygroscopicus subsp. hygroscopicus]|nr:hypothetical protein Shyhy02_02430 [Streptomyces hygroscopicus subsp. hygroscopicus]
MDPSSRVPDLPVAVSLALIGPECQPRHYDAVSTQSTRVPSHVVAAPDRHLTAASWRPYGRLVRMFGTCPVPGVTGRPGPGSRAAPVRGRGPRFRRHEPPEVRHYGLPRSGAASRSGPGSRAPVPAPRAVPVRGRGGPQM